MTLGRSFGPMKIKARIATTASSLESIPNMSALQGLAGFVVPGRRRWRDRLLAARSDGDRLAIGSILARELPRRLGPALLLVVAALLLKAALLFLILVGHPLLEAFEAVGDVAHHRGKAFAAEHQQQDDRDDENVPDAETAHWGPPLRRLSSRLPLRFPVEARRAIP